jgi:hypothetical protein
VAADRGAAQPELLDAESSCSAASSGNCSDTDESARKRSGCAALTKRLSQHWQASATYTLSWFYDADPQPFSGLNIVPFTVKLDLGGPGSYTLSSSDQRHRAVFNGIWQVGHGFQVSGLHYLGAGNRSGHTYGGDQRISRSQRQFAAAAERDDRSAQRLHPAGAEPDGHPPAAGDQVARALVDRSDRRIVQRLQPPNWGITTQESSANFGTRTSGQFRTVHSDSGSHSGKSQNPGSKSQIPTIPLGFGT